MARVSVTKTFFFCTGCAAGLTASDDFCAACGRETIDANRVIHLQGESARPARVRQRDVAKAADRSMKPAARLNTLA